MNQLFFTSIKETYSPKVDRAQTWIQNTDISTENVSVKEMFEETKMKTKNQKTEKWSQ